MENKNPARITPSFVVLYDWQCVINPGVKHYVFGTVTEAVGFWNSAGRSQLSASYEIVRCNNKSDMMHRINDLMVGVQYDEA